MKIRGIHIVLAILISVLFGYYIGTTQVSVAWKNYKPQISVNSKEPPPSLQNVDFSTFWIVWNKIQQNYYDKTKLDSQKLVNGAISGMLSGLDDPYTLYLPPEQNNDFKQGLAGEFQGIGAELGMEGKQIIVVAPIAGSPAEKAGVKPGDSILKVDDQSTFGWTLTQAVEKIKGPKGTQVTLQILHKSESKPTAIQITRDVITLKSVDGWVKNVKDITQISAQTKQKTTTANVMYIRLSQFGDKTNDEWIALINNLILKKDGNTKGVILDLRNNPGGYLTDATFIASEFLKDGIVVIQEKSPGDDVTMAVSRKGLLTEVPVIVLINKGSASASEIVAGALRDHGRAKLVGDTSFGKGTIQEAEDLGNGAGLHITIAKWLTPNRTWVHGKGLTPDVSVSLDEKTPTIDSQLDKAIQELIQ